MHTKNFKGYTLTNSILFYSKYFPRVHGTDLTTAFDNANKKSGADMELAIDIFTAMAIAGTKELRDRGELYDANYDPELVRLMDECKDKC